VENNETQTLTISDPRKWFFRISGATLGFFIIVGISAVQYSESILDWRFVTEAEARERAIEITKQVEELKSQVTSSNRLIQTHIKDFDTLSKQLLIADAISTYKATNEKLWLHQRDEQVNGETEASARRRHELETELVQAKEYRDCIISEKPNCSALRPQ